MKKYHLILTLFLLSSCNQNIVASDEQSSDLSSSFSSESISESSSVDYVEMEYQHLFIQSDFNTAGGITDVINGITWNYSTFSFLGGSSLGVQIGSKNNPQSEWWTMQATFTDEIIITSYDIELCNASSGSAVYDISFGDYQDSNSFASPNELMSVAANQLNVATNTFSLSLKSNGRAIYLYSLSMTMLVPSDSSLSFSKDETTASAVIPGENGIPSVNYSLISQDAYYASIDFTASTEELFSSLRNLISTMTAISYGDAKTMLQYTDESVEQKGYLYGLYDGDLILAKWDSGASWNREHVWACSQMKLNGVDPRPSESAKNHATDLHNLRVACPMANGAHGNKFYDTQTTSTTLFPNIMDSLSGYHQYDGDFRGDVARILFYMYLRYDGLKLNDELNVADDVSMGKLSVLLTWNQEDPVDDFEIQRNNRIYEYQGNRNPFIDYSNLADLIFSA